MRPLRLAACLAVLLCTAAPGLAQLKIAGPATPTEAPLSLTTADGTGLKLVGLDARAIVDGPMAFTELRMVFENPEPRIIEGHFQVTLPEGAAISRFAMEINGAWMEGEVVEKQAARRAYEDALHRRQDPALLEQDAGNSFRARVFPIPANGRKSLIISWSHELKKAGESYRLPLLGLPQIEKLNLTALTAASGAGPKSSLDGKSSQYQVSTVEKTNFTPDQDWVLSGVALPESGDARRNGNLAVARFVVPGAEAFETFDGAVVLIDTSASRALDFAGRLARAQALINGLATLGTQRVQVIAYDQQASMVFEGAPAEFGAAQVKKLLDHRALGASNLGAGLAAALASQGKNRRLILLSDGVITAGPRDKEALRSLIATLPGQGITRVDAVVDTTARDASMLDALVTAQVPSPGQVVEGRDPLEAQLARLRRKALADVKVTVPGAEWVWPETLRGVQGGDTVVVYADVPKAGPLFVDLSGGVTTRITPATTEAEKPLLERAWVAARIARLDDMATRGDRDLAAALRGQIIALSTRHRVLSPYTALVVLETENDYARFNIDRRALADILTVGPTGLEVLNQPRAALAVRPMPTPRPEPRRTRNEDRREAPAKKMARREMAKDKADSAGDDFAAAPSGGAPAAATAAAEAPMEAMEEQKAAESEADEAPGAMGRASSTAAPAAEPMPVADEGDGRGASGAPPPPAMRVAADESERSRGPANRRRPNNQVLALATAEPTGEEIGRNELRDIEKAASSLTGDLAVIDGHLKAKNIKAAVAAAEAWRDRDPTDLLALVGLGRAYEAAGDMAQAARAFGSILDLYPSRADMRRMAGNWLSALGLAGFDLAADTYGVAAEQRPDHPSVYHQLAMVLLRAGRAAEAFETLATGLEAKRVDNRFPGVDRILQADLQLAGAVWAAQAPDQTAAIAARLQALGLQIDTTESLRFVLTWETDANDVDFHIFDGKFNHAYYSRRGLATGGELFADVTTGYGPECFAIEAPKAYPYLLKAHYYRKGPMGHGAGAVQVIRHDGKGHLGFEDRPFVIMQDGAYVDLGKVTADTARIAAGGALQKAR